MRNIWNNVGPELLFLSPELVWYHGKVDPHSGVVGVDLAQYVVGRRGGSEL